MPRAGGVQFELNLPVDESPLIPSMLNAALNDGERSAKGPRGITLTNINQSPRSLDRFDEDDPTQEKGGFLQHRTLAV